MYEAFRGGGRGGAISISGTPSPTIRGNVIVGNTADKFGGGINCGDNSTPLIEGNVIADNLAYQFGGGVRCRLVSAILNGNTFTGNRAYYGDGGGIYCRDGSSVTIRNCIFWADSARDGSEIFVADSSEVVASYSDIEGGWPGEGNIAADPLFVAGPHGDYYLSQLPWQMAVSPCVDAGDPNSMVPEGSTKIDEFCDTWPVDMGYHYTPCTLQKLLVCLFPDDTTLVPGDTVGYTIDVTNNTGEDQTFEYWSNAHLWNGDPYKKNPIFGPKLVMLAPGKTRQGHLSHRVPEKIPILSYYALCGCIGFHPQDLWNYDCFRFWVDWGAVEENGITDWRGTEAAF